MNRTERRRQRAATLGSAATHPASRRLLSNYQKYGRRAAEIYTQYDDGTGNPRYFDVFAARLWCSKNKSIEPLAINLELVRELQSNGSIDQHHITSIRFDQNVAPLIFLNDASIGGGLLLDGAHRYVAFCEELQKKGLAGKIDKVPAYVLDPTEWRKFVIPPAVAESFRLGGETL